MHSDPHLESQAPAGHHIAERRLHAEGHGRHRVGVVGPGHRQPGHGHVGIADRLDLLDPVDVGEVVERREDFVQQADQMPGVGVLRKLSETLQVGEENGDLWKAVCDRGFAVLETVCDLFRQDVAEQPLRLLPFEFQFGHRPLQRREGGVAFQETAVGVGVDADAGDEFNLIGQLDQIVVGPRFEEPRLDDRLFPG